MSYKIKFPCNICGKEHERTVPNKSSAIRNLETGKKLAFCSAICRQQWHFEHRVVSIRVCISCKKEFSINPKKGNKLCSRQCYSEDRKSNPENYGLLEKVKAMRCNVDKEAATKKMLQTKADRGLLIDWNLSEWKQYWRRCNDLTRKIRSRMLVGWDGYDYIDGEYIKDNLALHFSHKNYPTLDHIVPRSQGFREGISPRDITCPENLAWTKRSNNSKKNNKV